MSFFNRIFSDKRNKSKEAPKKPESSIVIPEAPTAEYARLLQFTQRLNSLLLEDKYLARSDYKQLIDEYADINTFFQNQKTATTLGLYCEKFAIPAASVEAFLRNYADLSDLREGSTGIQQHNQTYLQKHLVSEKHYLDTVLSKVDPVISLDEEQRKVVLTDEDYMLVVAGAGAGKTTTVAAKVKYLVERKSVAPEQILVISFTNKAVGELRDKINKALKINCPVTTFHKTGYAILWKQDVDKKNVVDSGFMFDVINNYLKNDVLREPEMVNKLILFFGSYFDAPYEGDDLNAFFNYISKAYPKAKLSFLTTHRSKGLGYDNVVIINAVNATYGFPSKIEDDPVMKLVIREDRTIEYAEERRLFYVAMTRTKNRVYIAVPQQRPSRFVAELVQEYDKVCVNGELDISKTDSPDISMIKRCPICGYPLQYKHKKDFGLRLWICTNEPEICDFMTNDLSGGILPILKCDCCKDGYLIVRTKDRTPFLGCTNYKADKSGCNRKINLTYYENMLKRGEIEL